MTFFALIKGKINDPTFWQTGTIFPTASPHFFILSLHSSPDPDSSLSDKAAKEEIFLVFNLLCWRTLLLEKHLRIPWPLLSVESGSEDTSTKFGKSSWFKTRGIKFFLFVRWHFRGLCSDQWVTGVDENPVKNGRLQLFEPPVIWPLFKVEDCSQLSKVGELCETFGDDFTNAREPFPFVGLAA